MKIQKKTSSSSDDGDFTSNTTCLISRPSRRKFLKTTAKGGAGALAGLAAWGSGLSFAAAADTKPIKIGAINHGTGSLSVVGIDLLRGMEVAVADINAAGGVQGRKVILINEDDAGKPATAVDKAAKLITSDKVDVLMGVVSTSVSLALQNYVKQQKVIFVNGGSGSDTIMEPENNSPYFFHAKWDNSQVTVAARYVAEQQKPGSRWYFVAADYEWGHDSVTKMRAQAEAVQKIEVVGTQFVPLDTSDYSPVVTRIASTAPDVIAIAIPGAGYSALIRAVKLFGIRAQLYHDYVSTIEAGGAGDAANGLIGGVDFALDSEVAPLARPFAERFRKRYNAWPSWTAAGGATAVQTYLAAVSRAGGTTVDDVIAAMVAEPFQDTVKGRVWYRECDHQLVVPIFVAEYVHGGAEQYGLKTLHTYTSEEVGKLMRPCPTKS